MSSPLGFVVLARRPNPWAQDPWDYWPIGRLFPTAAAAITALAKGELADDIERENVAYRIDQDSLPHHRHHRDCIHNLSPEEQIANARAHRRMVDQHRRRMAQTNRTRTLGSRTTDRPSGIHRSADQWSGDEMSCIQCNLPEPREWCWDSDPDCPCGNPPRYGPAPRVSRTQAAILVDRWIEEADGEVDAGAELAYRHCAKQLCGLIGVITERTP